ncbi:MAG: DNA methyltransferase [Candidatus Sulfotelmatobacter sp.]
MTRERARDLGIEQLPIDELKLDPRNPRHHSDLQIGQIARSIENFGFNVPIVIDSSNNILAGHGRVLAARKLGWPLLPVIRLTHLTPEQARAFSIADNRLTENSTWDDRLLGEIFRDLATLDLDFNLEATGFSVGEIDLRIEGLSPSAESEDPDDRLAATLGQPPVTELGDLWLLGKHRILCADALDASSYRVLMERTQAQVIFTDPPYNVRIDGHASGNGSIHHREFAMAAGEMTSGQFIHFLATVLYLLVRHSSSGSIHFICMDWRHQLELLTAGSQAYSELKNLCVWVKGNAGMGSFYRSQHELIFVFKHGKASHQNNIQLGQYGRDRSNVWNYPGVINFGRQSEEGNLLALHPTVKPVALVADALLDCSARGDLVLDAFLGSGSTLIAAERVGRVCHGIEIDPVYVDVAIRRWQRHTGDYAVQAVTGKRFGDCANGHVGVPRGR